MSDESLEHQDYPEFERVEDYLDALEYCMESELLAKRTYEILSTKAEDEDAKAALWGVPWLLPIPFYLRLCPKTGTLPLNDLQRGNRRVLRVRGTDVFVSFFL